MKRIALVPIDNRPVCYCLPKQIAEIDSEIELFLPERNLLGDLTKSANIEVIFQWLSKLENIDYIILSLDTLAYGGLINSRRSGETFAEIKNRLEMLKQILQNKKAKVYAFSSIMRISNNNVNEEEKEYWSRWGKRIFDWSYNFHRAQELNEADAQNKHICINTTIPEEILQDYIAGRNRNFEINLLYLDWLAQGVLDFAVFSKDDCAKFGLNVIEAQKLQLQITKNALCAQIKTGADEIPMTLLAKVLSDKKQIKIFPRYMHPESVNEISKYEDISVSQSVNSQIELAGACFCQSEEDADITLLINNFKNEQGELVMNVFEPENDKDFALPKKPWAAADILNANGADNSFVKNLLAKNFDNFHGYAAWNTTGNTLGSLLCICISKYCAQKVDEIAFKKVQMIRFLDDWAYQANVRSILKQKFFEPDSKLVKEKMQQFESVLKAKFAFSPQSIGYSFPWNRLFEIEVEIDDG